MKLKLLFLIVVMASCYKIHAQAGTLDTSFGTDGITVVDVMPSFGQYVTNTIVKNDGRILLAGWGGDGGYYETCLLQLNPDGTRDSSFGTNGVSRYSYDSLFGQRTNDVVILPNGKMLIAVEQNDMDKYLMICLLNADGTPDPSFGNNGAIIGDLYPDMTATCIALDADYNIIIGASKYDSGYRHAFILKIDSFGDTDTLEVLHNVGSSTSPGDISELSDITILPDGKILAIGYRKQTATGTGEDMMLLQLNADGSPDTDFGTDGYTYVHNANGTIANERAMSMAFTADNKMLISGISTPSPQASPYLSGFLMAQFNDDGTPDAAFGTDGQSFWSPGADYMVVVGESTTLQPDGKILLSGGKRPDIAGVDWDNVIVRFNSDGTPDDTFGTDAQFTITIAPNLEIPAYESVTTMNLLPDGRLIAGGGGQGYDMGLFFAMRVFTGLELNTDNHDKTTVALYPNPASHTLYLNPDVPANEDYTILDMNGRTVHTGIIGTQGIPVEGLAQGVYVLKAGSYNPVRFVKE